MKQTLNQTKKETGTQKIFKRGVMVVGTGLVVVTFIVQVGLAARVATQGEEIRNLELRKASLELEINRLHQEITEASSIRVIEEKATNELGMVKELDQVKYMKLFPRSALATR